MKSLSDKLADVVYAVISVFAVCFLSLVVVPCQTIRAVLKSWRAE